MLQKIIQVGNSAAVTLSKEHLDYLGLSVGDKVYLVYSVKNKTITIYPAKKIKIFKAKIKTVRL